MISIGLLAVSLLTLAAAGIQVWLSSSPWWAVFRSSLVASALALVLFLWVVGKDLGWWQVDSQFVDTVAPFYAVATLGVAVFVYWFTR